MDIIINNEKIDFTLENEKNVGEVVFGIENWLQTSGFLITSLQTDNEHHELGSEDWKEIPVEKVDKLNLTAQLPYDIKISKLQTFFQYIDLLKSGIEKDNDELVQDLLKEYSYLSQELDKIFSSKIEKSPLITRLNELIEKTKLNNGSQSLSQSDKVSYLEILSQINILLLERIKEFTHPLESLKSAGIILNKSVEEISEVAIQLQTGQDQLAMGSVIRFIELSQKMIRIFHILQEAKNYNLTELKLENKDFKDFYTDLNSILNELSEAFIANDTVLIGDLLEYEIAPRLERLIEIIEAIEGEKEKK
jgi:hypothetical protein